MKIKRAASITCDGAHVAAARDAEGPAASVVLQAREGFQRTAIAVGIIPAADEAPLRMDGPQHRKIRLIELAAAEAIARVEEVLRVALIMEQDAAFLNLVLVGVPLQIRGRGPLRGEAGGKLAHEVGLATLGHQGAGQAHAWCFEIMNLTDRRAQPFATTGAFEQTAREPRAELVGVADAIGVGVAVFAEYLRVAEIELRGIEDRKVALIAIRDAQVIKPRFEGLGQRSFVDGELAFQVDTAVEAVHRHALLRAVVGAGGVGQVIAGVAKAELRDEEVAQGLQGPAHRGFRMDARAGQRGCALKVDEFGPQRVVAAERVERRAAREQELGQALIGPIGRGDGRIHGLVVLYAREELVALAGVREIQAAVEMGNAGGREIAAEFAEIARVGDVIEDAIGAPARGERMLMLCREGAAIAAEQGIVRQVFGVDTPGVVGIQIAELAAREYTTVFHEARRDGRVTVGRDIPVKRYAQIEAGLIAVADGGREQAGLALVVEREIDVRQVDERYAFEAHDDVACHADRFALIECDVAGAQLPINLAWVAGGVGRTTELSDVGVLAHDGLGLAVGMALRVSVSGFFDLASLGRKIEARRLAVDREPALPEAHRARCVDQASLVVVLRLVRLDLLAAAPHEHVAAHAVEPVAETLAVVGGDLGLRIAVSRVVRRGLVTSHGVAQRPVHRRLRRVRAHGRREAQ